MKDRARRRKGEPKASDYSDLVENAIERNPGPEPTVWIRVEQTETAVRTIVEDEAGSRERSTGDQRG